MSSDYSSSDSDMSSDSDDLYNTSSDSSNDSEYEVDPICVFKSKYPICVSKSKYHSSSSELDIYDSDKETDSEIEEDDKLFEDVMKIIPIITSFIRLR